MDKTTATPDVSPGSATATPDMSAGTAEPTPDVEDGEVTSQTKSQESDDVTTGEPAIPDDRPPRFGVYIKNGSFLKDKLSVKTLLFALAKPKCIFIDKWNNVLVELFCHEDQTRVIESLHGKRIDDNSRSLKCTPLSSRNWHAFETDVTQRHPRYPATRHRAELNAEPAFYYVRNIHGDNAYNDFSETPSGRWPSVHRPVMRPYYD